MLEASVVTAKRRKKEPAIPAQTRCCANCEHWRKRKYIHCQHSGPWGGDISGDKNCTFKAKKDPYTL